MKIVIHGHHLALPADVGSFLRKHVLRSLARLHDSPAAELTVKFADTRPNKGGVDRTCRLTLRLPGTRTLHVESVQEDAYKALLDAADRLKRLVKREVEKMRSPSRRPTQRPLGRTWRKRATQREAAPAGTPSTL